MRSMRSLAIAVLLAAGLVSSQTSNTQCVKGLKVFVARGTGEVIDDAKSNDTTLLKETGLGNHTRGLGETGRLLKPIFDKIPDSNYTAILYPASNGRSYNNESNYFESAINGTEMVRKAMIEYATACPDGKMAWLGYSQGAQIISNSLCGMSPVWAQFSSVTGIPAMLALIQPLPKNVTENIIATLLMGDPSHKNGTNYNYGTHNMTGNGIFYRGDTSACDAMGKRIRSYCDSGDPFCDVGPTFNPNTHGIYVKKRKEEFVNYIIEQWNNGGDTGEVSTTTRSGSSPSSTDNAENGAANLFNVSSLGVVFSLIFFILS